ncbi:hypothetical protein ACQ86N_04835 [Puia sp. P3]|uniref:hypothetical protein n=1 Tax=Puia sp. P3 TaxID=3423952 RepID=UPI003D664515
MINNSFTRYGGRFNIDHNATDRLVFGVNLAVDRSQLNKVTNDNEFSTLVSWLPNCLLRRPPTHPRDFPTQIPFIQAAFTMRSMISIVRLPTVLWATPMPI